MNKEPYIIVIPARYSSQRLPGKALLEINGLPMIQHVWNAAQLSDASRVVVATDDERIKTTAKSFGAECVMTDPAHQSGSDRITECASSLGLNDDQLLVSLQGDEPEMPAECLNQVAGMLADNRTADVATLFSPIVEVQEVNDPNVVKLVQADNGMALYFSRATIPHLRGGSDEMGIAEALSQGVEWKRHIGLYAYRFGALKSFSRAGPSQLEILERLEQLRFLELGKKIIAARASAPVPAGIDTPEDLDRARARF